MVKVCQPVAAVVTFQAIVAKLLSMLGHEGGVGVLMAGDALDLFRGETLDVAIPAIQRRAIVILLVARQAKIGEPFMIKAGNSQFSNVRRPSFVVGVAMLAAAAVWQQTMQSGSTGALLGHVFVAIFAAAGGMGRPSSATNSNQ